MRFVSTGGQVRDVSFEEAVFTGFAQDGGVLMPEELPRFLPEELAAMRGKPYAEVVKKVAGKFVDASEITPEQLSDLIDVAFSGFSKSNDIAPLHPLTPNLGVLELWHGPTLAFKDYGLSCLAQFVKFFQRRKQRRAVAIIATSGDTGSAALEAFKDMPLIDVVVLLPKEGISRVQELQMTTVGGSNTHIIRVQGSPDDLDDVAKSVLLNEELGKDLRLFSVNSINFGRIMIQAAHHIFAYLQASTSCEDEVEIVIPSGALGNITSGCMARAMGVPVKFVLCSTENDIAHRMLLTGQLLVASSAVDSLASAMIALNPYNLQRLFWLFSLDKGDAARLAREFDAKGSLTLPGAVLGKMRDVITDSRAVNNAQILEAMRTCDRRFRYVVCPHTACALSFCFEKEDDSVRRVAIATASPAKFQEALTAAEVGCPAAENLLRLLEAKAAKFEDWLRGADWRALLAGKIRAIEAAGPHRGNL